MKYQIKIDYRTGDSFSSEDTSDVLEEVWTNLDIAKQNLVRIKEHYVWYEDRYDKPWKKGDRVEKPKWLTYEDKHDAREIIMLLTDEGKEWQFWASWCGYFETLYGAEIILEEDDGLSFTL
jgi:hypothetical protein